MATKININFKTEVILNLSVTFVIALLYQNMSCILVLD